VESGSAHRAGGDRSRANCSVGDAEFAATDASARPCSHFRDYFLKIAFMAANIEINWTRIAFLAANIEINWMRIASMAARIGIFRTNIASMAARKGVGGAAGAFPGARKGR
jgi:hypothetical protein